MEKLQAVRGMNDVLPDESYRWQYLEKTVSAILAQYGYQEIRLPIVEKTALFKRSVGEVTDIVEKEMYTFDDRNGECLSLRPEGTAGCVRAGIEHGLLYNQVQRLWYQGPLFRHERPQKGRYRQFYQIGVEAFGMSSPLVDVEMIALSYRIWEALGITQKVRLELNTLGNPASRLAYREALVAYLKKHESALDEDSLRRMTTNPLRVLDTKNPEMKAIVANAPKLQDYLDDASKAHFDRVCTLLKALNIDFVLNPTLVRGLDYYCHTVFEWVTDELGAQGTICAGGRYDGLVEQLGGKSTPGIGFALGIERVIALIEEDTVMDKNPDVYMLVLGEAAEAYALQTAEALRAENCAVQLDATGAGMKAQMKKANASGARFAMIIGDAEAENKTVTVKHLDTGEQVTVDNFVDWFVGVSARGDIGL